MKHTPKILVLLACLFILVYSCKKEGSDSSSVNPVSSGSMTATISGRAVDESDNAVSNATVTISGQTTTTDQYGIFVLKNISVDSRCIASITKTGFFNCTHAFLAKANTVNYIKVVLLSNAQTHTLSATAGGTVSLSDGSSIQFSPNGFVVASSGAAYSGTVYLSVKHLSPDAANFGFMIPGGDLLGKNTAGSDVALYTYGMIGAELKGNSGEMLQLATATTATLTLAIAPSQTGTAPSSIPLWYFDEAASLWKEEGSASRVGNNYVGTVAHFSWWNCDYQGPRAMILGKVIDCNGLPMPNVVVTVNGWYNMVTNQGGVYSDYVPVGMTFTVQVLASNNQNLFSNSQVENVPPLSPNQTYIVPDLIVSCPARISGTLKTCQGNTIDGEIIAVWSGGSNIQYSLNGNFNLPCPPSTLINIDARASYNSTIFSSSGQYSSSIVGNTTNIGSILLCDSVSGSPNDLTINGGPFSNQYFAVPTSSALFSGTTIGILYTNTSSSGYNLFTYQILTDFITPGIGSWTSNSGSLIYMQLSDGMDNYFVQTDRAGTSGTINLTYVGPIGGYVIGNFSGTSACSKNSQPPFPVTISGHFHALRQ